LLKGFSKPKELAKKSKDNGYTACGITDYKSISGAVSFYQACKKVGIKAIIGCSFDKYTLIAKNKNGWHDLIELVSSLDEDGNISFEISKRVFDNHNLICLADKKFNSLGDDSYAYSDLMPVSYYVNKEDSVLHRILLCSDLKTTLPAIQKKLRSQTLPSEVVEFFTSDKYHLLDSEQASKLSGDMSVIEEIVNKCEDYDILSRPMLPTFECPNGASEENYLKELCRIGWKKLLIGSGKISSEEKKKEYADRFNEESSVIKDANLFGYFLIVQDIIRFVNDQGWLSGPGRGCFLPDTRVKMSNSLMKSICDIKVGDEVIDCNGNTQEVYDTLTYYIDEEIMELWFGDIAIRCTKDHKFMTNNRGWVEAQYLTEQDDILEV
jgi:DNA polymerase-3 subunit alpha